MYIRHVVRKRKWTERKRILWGYNCPTAHGPFYSFVFSEAAQLLRAGDSTSQILGCEQSTFYSDDCSYEPTSVTLSHSWDDASEGGPLVGLVSSSRPMDGINGELGELTSRLVISTIS